MKLLFIFCLVCFLSCSTVVMKKIPEFTDEPYLMMNASGSEPIIELVFLSNREIIMSMLKENSVNTKNELRKRLKERNSSYSTKLLSAGVLSCMNDSEGQMFLLQSGRNSNDFDDTKNIFWLIGHLNWFLPYDANNARPKLDMHWAESFMFEMLSVPKLFNLPDHSPPLYDRRSLAIDSSTGSFAEILSDIKSQKLFPILVDLWNNLPLGMNSNEILSGFEELEDKKAIPILIEALKRRKGGEYRFAASALAKMKVQEAIPILLVHLDDYDTYYALSRFNDDRILPALQKSLPNLKEYALGAAKMLIIELNGEDKLPQMINLAKDPNHKNMYDLLEAILKLKDERAIPFAIDQLKNSSELYRRSNSIRILETFPSSRVAIKALIDVLDFDFQSLADGKNVAMDNNTMFHQKIAEALKGMTKQSLGENKDKWLEYYQNTYKSKE